MPNKPTLRKKRQVLTNGPLGVAQVQDAVASGLPELPKHLSLRKQDIPFWDAILRARARDEWGRVELVLAQQLARIQSDIEECQKLTDTGDREKVHEKGFSSMRAAQQNIGALIAQQLTLMRALQIVGTVIGDPVDNIPRRKAEREAEQTINRLKRGSITENSVEEPPLLNL